MAILSSGLYSFGLNSFNGVCQPILLILFEFWIDKSRFFFDNFALASIERMIFIIFTQHSLSSYDKLRQFCPQVLILLGWTHSKGFSQPILLVLSEFWMDKSPCFFALPPLECWSSKSLRNILCFPTTYLGFLFHFPLTDLTRSDPELEPRFVGTPGV